MRCSCCDSKLTDYETTLKHAVTGAYLDTCLDCLSDIAKEVPMPVKGRKDLLVNVQDTDNNNIEFEGLSDIYNDGT